jgi:hypothetical protein
MLAIAGTSSAKPTDRAGSYTLVEDASLVHPGNASPTAAEARSSGPEPFTWGAVDLPIPPTLTLRQLTQLSTDYKLDVGSCWGGSPRFEAWVTNGTGSWKIFFYMGPAPNYTGCASDVYTRSGNLATPASPVDAAQVGGTYDEPFSRVQADYGNYAVTHVYLDVDGGWYANQAVDFDNTKVNKKLTTYEH